MHLVQFFFYVNPFAQSFVVEANNAFLDSHFMGITRPDESTAHLHTFLMATARCRSRGELMSLCHPKHGNIKEDFNPLLGHLPH